MSDFFGLPIEGERPEYRSNPAEQADPAELIEKLQAVLAFPEVENVRWEQFTPYFNDGDVCEFSVYTAYVKLVGREDGGDYNDGYLEEADFRWYPERYEDVANATAISSALREFSSALGGGSHERILIEKFGDPAQVTATRDGFSIEFYEHD
jgi:hypothetical protein